MAHQTPAPHGLGRPLDRPVRVPKVRARDSVECVEGFLENRTLVGELVFDDPLVLHGIGRAGAFGPPGSARQSFVDLIGRGLDQSSTGGVLRGLDLVRERAVIHLLLGIRPRHEVVQTERVHWWSAGDQMASQRGTNVDDR